MRKQKRLDVLLQAVALFVPRFPGLRVLLVGDGSERASLEALVEELGLGETVMMLGSRGDVRDVLEAFDVAAVSSDFEGSPLAVMEYMEAGLPVVSTAVGGLPKMIHDGSTAGSWRRGTRTRLPRRSPSCWPIPSAAPRWAPPPASAGGPSTTSTSWSRASRIFTSSFSPRANCGNERLERTRTSVRRSTMDE